MIGRTFENIVLAYDGEFVTNVPKLVCHHSPTGFAWGYHGSGCADLALNILEWALRDMDYDGPRMDCWKGRCYTLAWTLHQQFKTEVVANIPEAGGTLTVDFVRTWLKEHVHGSE